MEGVLETSHFSNDDAINVMPSKPVCAFSTLFNDLNTICCTTEDLVQSLLIIKNKGGSKFSFRIIFFNTTLLF